MAPSRAHPPRKAQLHPQPRAPALVTYKHELRRPPSEISPDDFSAMCSAWVEVQLRGRAVSQEMEAYIEFRTYNAIVARSDVSLKELADFIGAEPRRVAVGIPQRQLPDLPPLAHFCAALFPIDRAAHDHRQHSHSGKWGGIGLRLVDNYVVGRRIEKDLFDETGTYPDSVVSGPIWASPRRSPTASADAAPSASLKIPIRWSTLDDVPAQEVPSAQQAWCFVAVDPTDIPPPLPSSPLQSDFDQFDELFSSPPTSDESSYDFEVGLSLAKNNCGGKMGKGSRRGEGRARACSSTTSATN
ncbi:hypothetical protein BDK51DRAFT_39313 [Blyttiomyces helicus]|uniref:Uncharacterized protein n=1 Tax=Blyttiomyces helicus TaxID=388810 RepID=A0A4P9WHB8_9FUNG|nr:hypothetical protein BDK51DRAFT_39313 [Blyttiomyces helicus]|eukprot:RKO90470.1 hypothetical protein BDK51DRAFT_39313 [Blyttiomyces helicus]